MNWVLAAASALALTLLFPPWNLPWLAPVALVPLLIAAAREPLVLRRFALGYAAGALYWFATCQWIQWTIQTHGGMSAASAWFVFTLFALAKALQLGTFAALAGWTLRGRWAVPATAALWVAIEWTHAPLGFAWLDLGNAAIDWPFVLRAAPFAGVWGVSFLLALVAAEIANAVRGFRGLPGFAILALVLLAALPRIPESTAAPERARLIQPNIDEEERWTPQSFSGLLRRMRTLSVAPVTNADVRKPPLLIWPEAPAPFYDDDAIFTAYLRDVAREYGGYFVAGMIAHTPAKGMLNSTAVFGPDGLAHSRYDKVHLVPFGEFVPWPLRPIAFQVSTEAGDFTAGREQVVSLAGAHTLATFICYESVFPDFIRGFVKRGAELLVNPSNDGWFGKTAARRQHLQIVRMRAVENARWILRDTNDGITGAIDPAGRVRETLPLYAEAAGDMRFAFETRRTFYTEHGDWFVLLSLLLSVLGVATGRYSGTSMPVRISSRIRSLVSPVRAPDPRDPNAPRD